MDLGVGSGDLVQIVAFCSDDLGIEGIDLVEANDLRFFGQAVTVMGEFFADRAVSVGDIVERAIDQVKNNGAAFDMAEEAGTDACAFARAFDQSGEVGQDKFLIMQPNDAELRL
jgi:hypothetical protein